MTKHKRAITLVVITLIGGILVASVGALVWRGAPMERALKSGRENIEVIRQLSAVFPDIDHKITYYSGDNGRPVWRSRIGINRRYILDGQVPITLNASRTVVTGNGQPTIVVTEIVSIAHDQDGRMNVSRRGPYVVTAEMLERFINEKGDIRAILGPDANTTPVDGFRNNYDVL